MQQAPASPHGSIAKTLVALALALPAFGQESAPAQGDAGWRNPGDPVGVAREAMWFAPTAADWERPVAITFQRTFEDALAVSRETGKPILACINMDGEIASEHYAGVRYRRPETAALYEPYVCVIASVYRHSPRDHDEAGRRILCPRFGSVTCGEHIAIEPLLFERYMKGQRVAPRHIMIELDGSETYDVYYAFDTASVFDRLRRGILERPEGLLQDVVRGDRPIVERVASRDIVDRRAVEEAYERGDAALRRALLEAAAEHIDAAPVDLLRRALFGLDGELGALARQALARARSEDAVDLIAEALRAPLAAEEREALVGALAEIGSTSPRARSLAVVHRGLASRSREIDLDGWSSALSGGASYAGAVPRSTLEARMEIADAGEEAVDGEALLVAAEATLMLAIDPTGSPGFGPGARQSAGHARLLLEDARRQAQRARAAGAGGWRVPGLLALCAFYLGEVDEAYARALEAGPTIPAGAPEWSAISTLALFAQARQRAITEAVRAKRDWPGEWLTDVDAAYAVLAQHPLGTDQHVVQHQDFLRFLGAGGRADRVLEQGLARFPDSWTLHERLRGRILWERGVEGLEEHYRERLERADASPNLPWFAGYASLVAAEFHRRRGRPEAASRSYDRAVELYERSVAANPTARASADHYVALSLAGRARLALEAGELGQALELVLASFERCEDAAATLDGLGFTPVMTATTLRARLGEAGRSEDGARLEAALGALRPELLLPPEFDRGGGTPPPERGGEGPRRNPRAAGGRGWLPE